MVVVVVVGVLVVCLCLLLFVGGVFLIVFVVMALCLVVW